MVSELRLTELTRELTNLALRRGREVAYWSKAVKSFDSLLSTGKTSGPSVPYGILEATYRFAMPQSLRNVRTYFRTSGKGFGEDALFAMWWLLLESLSPSRMLEIGVYRGQVLAFWSAWARSAKQEVDLYGLSPFSDAGDQVSKYDDIDYLADIQDSFATLGIPMFQPLKYLSTDAAAEAQLAPKFQTFDLVYVDGSHEYHDVLSDIELCRKLLRRDGIMVLDDAGRQLAGTLPPYAFRGHPGPSRAAYELMDQSQWRFIVSCGHNVLFARC